MTAFRLQTRLLAAAALLLAGVPGCDATVQIGETEDEGPLAAAAAQAGSWIWVPVEGAKCRNGSDTGFGARLRKGSSRLLIYLEGGGACFNDATCQNNLDSFGRVAFGTFAANAHSDAGLFDTTRSENPVAGWNAAYVPYCTGDVHAGSARDVRVPGVDRDEDGQDDLQQFLGHENMKRYLDILSKRFAGEVEHVLLAGSSAGGFGTLVNYDATREAFPEARVTLLDDSGPPVADDGVLTPELEARWMNLWNLERALSPETRAAVQKNGLAAIYARHAKRHPDQSFGLLSFLKDATIRDFYGYRQSGCDDPSHCVSGGAYANTLRDMRDQAPAWSTFFVEGNDHTFLLEGRFYDTSSGGTPLPEWTRALVNGSDAPDAAPPAD